MKTESTFCGLCMARLSLIADLMMLHHWTDRLFFDRCQDRVRGIAPICGILLLFAVGCNSASSPTDSSDPPAGIGQRAGDKLSKSDLANPVGTLKLAIRAGRWEKAWSASELILSEQPTSPIESETFALIARAAHETGRQAEAAEYLCLASERESYVSPPRVRQAMIAMIGVGKYYDGLQFLEQALIAQPDQHETRRWLFDFYIGAGDRVSAMPHGQKLVLDRQFDVDLLTNLSNTERRTLESTPLDQMVTRNPDDKRPLLGTAKADFDESKYEDAIRILREITAQHPEHHPSQAMLGRALAASGELDQLARWAGQQSDGIQAYPGYWIALGDWARGRDDASAAVRSFAQAADCSDPEVVQIWTRLATLLPEVERNGENVPGELVKTVNERAKQLGRFNQLKDRFTRTGGISRAIALEIAGSLESLGRLWEAEAWASVATTLPADDSVDVAGYRNELVKRLNPQTPWRLPETLPDFRRLRSQFPLPEIEKIVSASLDPKASSLSQDSLTPQLLATNGQVVDWKMADEAAARGLRFWGRTGDSLDKPGIMLYQTLGCGGGTIDFDLDGWSDLYLADAGGTPPQQDSAANELFRNLGGRFQPVATLSRTADRGFGQGVAVGDLNEDGFPDLLVLNYGPNRMYLNNGDGTFRDVSDRMPQPLGDEWSSSAAIADIDGDGLADVVIVNYCAGLEPLTKLCPMKDSGINGSCSPMLFPALDDRFLKNDGKGQLTDQTRAWNAVADSAGRGLGVMVGDLDGVKGNEIFIANDMTNNHYWSRVGSDADVGFEQVGFELGESAMLRGVGGDDRGIPQGSMGIAMADFDQDGDADLYVTNFDKEYNTLHQQTSGGVWQDRTSAAGLVTSTMPLVGFGVEAVDVDNTGELSLFVANGHVDLFSRGAERAIYVQPMQVFRPSTKGAFREVAIGSIGDYFGRGHVGRGLWAIDADRNGRVDLVVTHQTEPTALLINHCDNDAKWVRLELRGRKSSRDAVGSRVVVQSSQARHTVFRTSGDGYQCSSDPVLHVGLGTVPDETVSVVVDWPSGRQQRFDAIATDTQTVLVEANDQPGN
ncbi:FG-GAP-like repeat-containing protein [Stieleria sp. TO1_6]|uniref:FG-GAP-like repeat-containing protein n=1 Tax=Stieleria tagensis TaxID=2956795 RepID=UPI00209B3B25|nr:FG-GAP-like repeat-containing protein [Stieleria tagensis]MCO8124909.1 FG-GAP-like repeat-containing protein [Stieleria tagensis]